MNLKSQNKINIQGGMSSMTDLVFLLLIFFIVLSTLANTDAIKVDLPSTKNSNPSNVRPNITISIDADEQFYINKVPVEREELENGLLSKIKSNDSEQSIVIAVDKVVPSQLTIETLSIVKEHGWKVVISTQKKNK